MRRGFYFLARAFAEQRFPKSPTVSYTPSIQADHKRWKVFEGVDFPQDDTTEIQEISGFLFLKYNSPK